MHLSYSVSKYKGKTYKSNRGGDKVKNRILREIGKLPDAQVEKIRTICKVAKDEKQILTRFRWTSL